MTPAWGKIRADGIQHALAAHSMDVAAVFEALAALPAFQRAMQAASEIPITPRVIAHLAAFVWLHDIGKLHPDFQAKAHGSNQPISHSSAGYGLVFLAGQEAGNPLHGLVRRIVVDRNTQNYLHLIFAHHGKPVAKSHDTPKKWGGQGYWPQAADYAAGFSAAFADMSPGPLPENSAFHHLFAGMVALADWIGSDEDFFGTCPNPGADYPEIARARAAEALAQIGLDHGLRLDDPDFSTLSPYPPRPAQSLIGAVDPQTPLAILEAETGSGKTEAALWHFARLFAAGQVDGLYFAVPTRAAARQLHARICAAMTRLFGDAAPEPVLAIPGQRQAGSARGKALPGFVTVWDDAEKPVKSRWAAEHATRFLAATVAVGTIDQALLAALQVKHAPMRAAALARSLLVIDEVHASDAYMTRVTRSLLDAHIGAGGRAFLMSATLGASARAAYLGQPLPDFEAAHLAPFPALWTEKGAMAAPLGPDKIVRMELVDTMSATTMAERAIAAARKGARVLVIRNTVGAAVQTWQAVQEAGAGDLLMQCGGGPALHHSRYAVEDRAALDHCVETILSPKGEGGGAIVIGSQTLEQSLDIDADILLTDLCPMDVLLQRLGRLHRHQHPRPVGFEHPTAVVFAPEDGLAPLAEPRYLNGLGAWKRNGVVQGIYIDLPILEATRRLIARRPEWAIPSMNRDLVERATHPECRAKIVEEMGQTWQSYDINIAGRDAAQKMIAQMNVLNRAGPFPPHFASDDQAVMTRLGEMGPVIDLPQGTLGAFGLPVTRIAVPAHWVHSDDVPRFSQEEDGRLLIEIGGVRMCYGREGLIKLEAKKP